MNMEWNISTEWKISTEGQKNNIYLLFKKIIICYRPSDRVKIDRQNIFN